MIFCKLRGLWRKHPDGIRGKRWVISLRNSLSNAVRKQTLIFLSMVCNFAKSSNPLICGIFTSSKASAYRPEANFDRASSGLVKLSTSYPAFFRPWLRTLQISFSSSTTSNLAGICLTSLSSGENKISYLRPQETLFYN